MHSEAPADFVGRPIAVGDVVVYPVKSGSGPAQLREGVIVAIARAEAGYRNLSWKLSIERPEEDWYLGWNPDSRAWGRVRTTLLHPDRIMVTGEAPGAFWSRHGVGEAEARHAGAP